PPDRKRLNAMRDLRVLAPDACSAHRSGELPPRAVVRALGMQSTTTRPPGRSEPGISQSRGNDLGPAARRNASSPKFARGFHECRRPAKLEWSAMGSLLIRDGRFIDPATGTDRSADLVILNGLVGGIGSGLSRSGVDAAIDARGCIVAPGLI